MRLFYWPSPQGNFGDDLNPWFWEQYFPGQLSQDDGTTLVGIGTVLTDQLPSGTRLIVMGSGAGYRIRPPATLTLDVRAVRGPLTARALGLEASTAVADPAILLSTWEGAGLRGARTGRPAFVPHWENADNQVWRLACKALDVDFVDPRSNAKDTIRAISGATLVVAESMHGAIIADAFRVPFVPIVGGHFSPFKWHDWAASMGLKYRPFRFPFKFGFQAFKRRGAEQLDLNISADYETFVARAEVPRGRANESFGTGSRFSTQLMRRLSFPAAVASETMALRQVLRAAPCLSTESILKRRQDDLLSRILRLQRELT